MAWNGEQELQTADNQRQRDQELPWRAIKNHQNDLEKTEPTNRYLYMIYSSRDTE